MLKNIWSRSVVLGLLSLVTMTANAGLGCLGPSKIDGIVKSSAVCDFTFSALATFACGVGLPQVGVFTVRNNSPVAIKINYIRLGQNDGFPSTDVTITGTTCGSALASGATCNVTVSANTGGPFNRILQVGVNSRQVELDSPVITPTTGCNVPTPISGSFPCALGTTSTFASLAGSTITNTGPTVINGDLGLSPGTAVTGFPPGVITGARHVNDATAAQAKIDLSTLYTCLAAQPCGTVIGTADQAGITRTSAGIGAVNVFCSGSSILNSGVLTLSGDATSVFIFQAGSTLTLNPSATIVLTGGLTPANVFWQVGSSATLGTSSVFQGTIAALASITMNTGATALGRTLAQTAAVTYDTNTVTLP
ncbi:MAG: ice-binding family protein [Gammaproteobacteria bacterium]